MTRRKKWREQTKTRVRRAFNHALSGWIQKRPNETSQKKIKCVMMNSSRLGKAILHARLPSVQEYAKSDVLQFQGTLLKLDLDFSRSSLVISENRKGEEKAAWNLSVCVSGMLCVTRCAQHFRFCAARVNFILDVTYGKAGGVWNCQFLND